MPFAPNYLRLNKTISRPLIYPTISGQGTYTNVLLIDNQVTDYQQMVDSVNASTFPIVYSVYSQKTELLELLQTHFTTIERLGLCFTFGKTKKFFDNQPLFSKNETQPYSENVQFILNLITQFQIKNIDYLACNTLTYSNWEAYYAILLQNTNVIIGASNNQTGNIQYGGDWVLESTSQDVELIYFSTTIKYYQYLLDNPSWANAAGQELNGPSAIVIDPTNTYLYVFNELNGGSGSIERILLSNPTIYVKFWCTNLGGAITSMVIDSTNTYMYALSMFAVSTNLYKIPIETPAESTIIKTAFTEDLAYMVIDNTDTYLYITNYYRESVSRITISEPIEGYIDNWSNFTQNYTNAINAAITSIASTGSIQSLIFINGIAIDPTSTYIYISRVVFYYPDNYNDYFSFITRILVSDPTINTPVWSSLTGIIDGYANTSMIIDSQNNYLYVIDFLNQNIFKINIANPTDYIMFVDGYNSGLLKDIPYGMTADIPNQYMYVSNNNNNNINNDQNGTIAQISFSSPLSSPPCFLHNTQILTDEGYVKIQYLRKGDRIQTLRHGFVPIHIIGFRTIHHPAQKERVKGQLYKYSTTKNPEIFEDLIVTGCHSVLVDDFISPEQREQTNTLMGDIFITDNKYRLPACMDEKHADVYTPSGEYIIYHFALEHADCYMNYGVYANGLLVESSSIRYMKELSQMTFFP
jgi:DNA-binding beta-propeller fold protein YncE